MAGQYGNQAMEMQGEVGQETRAIEGNRRAIALSRVGAQITIDQILQWAIDGRTYHAQQGDAATLLTFVEVAYDENQPQFALRVPTGRTVIPLSLIVSFQDKGGLDEHVIWSTTTNDIGNGASTDLTISPMRTDAPHASGCVARSLYTGDATAATGLIEVARWIDPFVLEAGSTTAGRFEWNIRTAAAVPVLVGPATLQMHCFSVTPEGEGFGEYVWAEFPTPDLVAKTTA